MGLKDYDVVFKYTGDLKIYNDEDGTKCVDAEGVDLEEFLSSVDPIQLAEWVAHNLQTELVVDCLGKGPVLRAIKEIDSRKEDW
jgi:hypothetical protein